MPRMKSKQLVQKYRLLREQLLSAYLALADAVFQFEVGIDQAAKGEIARRQLEIVELKEQLQRTRKIKWSKKKIDEVME